MRRVRIRHMALGVVALGVAGCLTIEVHITPWDDSDVQADIAVSKTFRVGRRSPDRAATREVWRDDFESYSAGPGTWAEPWLPDANASNHSVSFVDGATFKRTHGNVLRLQGVPGGNWAAVCYRRLDAELPLRVSFDVFNEAVEGTGAHPGHCTIALRTEPPSWTRPCVMLLECDNDGSTRVLGQVGDGTRPEMNQRGIDAEALSMDLGTWYHVELEVMQDGDLHVLTLRLDDGEVVRGSETFTRQGPDLSGFPYLELTAQENAVWFDNVVVEPLPVPQGGHGE
jgi:hypothetical protein